MDRGWGAAGWAKGLWGLCGSPWGLYGVPMCPSAFLLVPVGLHGVCVGPNAFLWGLCGSLRVCVGPNAFLWVCVGPNGSVWVPVPFYGVCVGPNAFVWAFRARVAVSACSPACRLLSPHTAGLGLSAHPRPFCASFPPRGKRWGSAVPIQPQ